MQTGKVKVLYIAGIGRSGSTIVGNMLGHIPGFFFVSEILRIWRYFVINNDPCGCGLRASDCEVWSAILSKAFADSGLGIAPKMDYWHHSSKNRHLPAFLLPQFSSGLKSHLLEYLDNLEKLYPAIQAVTESRVIVDGSKRPLYAAILSMIPTLDVYILHLVRDSRAVSYSWLRKKVQLNGVNMAVVNPATSAIRWMNANLVAESLRRKFPERYMFIRYEDLIERPQETIYHILGMIGEEPVPLPFIDEKTIKLGVNHAVGGNPNRGAVGNVKLQTDNEWKSKMRPIDKIIVSILTWPLLMKYGYIK